MNGAMMAPQMMGNSNGNMMESMKSNMMTMLMINNMAGNNGGGKSGGAGGDQNMFSMIYIFVATSVVDFVFKNAPFVFAFLMKKYTDKIENIKKDLDNTTKDLTDNKIKKKKIYFIFSFLVFFLTLLKLYLNYNLKSIDHHYLAIWYSTICKRIMYQHYRSQVSELTHEKWITFYSKFDKDCKIMADKKCPPFVPNITQKFMGGTSDVFITCIQLFVQSQLCPVKHTFVDILACSSTPLMQLIDEIEKIKTMHIADIMSLSELMKLDKITIIHLLFIEWNVSREIIKTIVKPHIKTPFPFKILSTSPLFFLFYTTWHEYFLRYAINFNEVTREHLYKMTSFEFENVYTFANASLGYDSHIDFRLSVDCDTASVSKIKIVVDEDSL